eukprot:m.89529 g.89529  ORF g.89529 m.89529 type:complete len:95 (+) comp36608_c0_seq11:621-905(+)
MAGCVCSFLQCTIGLHHLSGEHGTTLNRSIILKDLTKQGYQKQLRQLFRSAGFVDGRIEESGEKKSDKSDKDVSTTDKKKRRHQYFQTLRPAKW